MTVSVAPSAPNTAPTNNTILNSPSPAPTANSDNGPVSFKSTYEDAQHQQDDSSAPSSSNGKGAPAKAANPSKKDPRSAALVDVAALPKAAALPLSLQLQALAKSALAEVSNTTGTTDSPATQNSENVLQHAGTPIPDQPLPPLPQASSATAVNPDVAFALRLLGRDQAAPNAASKIADGASPAPKGVNTVTAPTDGLPLTPQGTPGSPVPAPKDVVPATAAIPTGKEIAASGPHVPVRESTPPDQIVNAKPRAAAPQTDSPKVATKQPAQEESGKGNDSPQNGSDRETGPAVPVRTLDARYSTATFAEVHDVVSTAAPEPAPASQAAPLNTHADALAPLKANDAPVPAAANNISLRLGGPDQTSATVRVLDRSGEIHVSVRASDPQLATTLRSDVDQLRSHLNARGWDTEVWKPEGAPALKETANHANSGSQQHASSARRDSQNQPQPRQQQDSSGKRPAWLDELEETIEGGQ